MKWLALTVFALITAQALGQRNPAIEKGSRAAYGIEARGREAAVAKGQADAMARRAAPFANVTDVESFVVASRKARNEAIATYYAEREKARTGKASKEKKALLDSFNSAIESAADPLSPYIPDISSPSIVTLKAKSTERFLKTIQVVDAHNAIVNCIESIVGLSNHDLWLTGVDTASWIDGQRVQLDGVLVKVGTKTYETLDGGTRTVAMMTKILLPADGTLTRAEDVREWKTDRDEKYNGVLLLYDLGRVKIKDMDGKVTTLRLTKLSDDDQDYVATVAPLPRRRQ